MACAAKVTFGPEGIHRITIVQIDWRELTSQGDSSPVAVIAMVPLNVRKDLGTVRVPLAD